MGGKITKLASPLVKTIGNTIDAGLDLVETVPLLGSIVEVGRDKFGNTVDMIGGIPIIGENTQAILDKLGIRDDDTDEDVKRKIYNFKNKLSVNDESVFKTNIPELIKSAIEKIISTIDKLINIMENNRDNFEKLINGLFDILKIFMNQIKELNGLLPIGLVIGLVTPVFILIANFISIF
eukprot:GHVU01019742.1.p1 GENE.GHVU01019742.1~~GHVU01019742.1.p1  ORF type:complete len:180 (-),score=29.59 GHVU01019742.1:388-927(-)